MLIINEGNSKYTDNQEKQRIKLLLLSKSTILAIEVHNMTIIGTKRKEEYNLPSYNNNINPTILAQEITRANQILCWQTFE